MASDDDLREFMLVLRRALLMINAWIERKYNLAAEPTYCDGCQKKINSRTGGD